MAGVAALGTYLYIDNELTRMYCGLTKVAEHNIGHHEQDLIAISNVNVLAPASDRFVASQTVIVRDGIIASVSDGTTIPTDAQVIDATGYGAIKASSFLDLDNYLFGNFATQKAWGNPVEQRR